MANVRLRLPNRRVTAVVLVAGLMFLACLWRTFASGELRRYSADADALAAPIDWVRLGADVNTADTDGKTPLMSAADGGNSVLTATLLDAGAKVDQKDVNGDTALIYAVRGWMQAPLNEYSTSTGGSDYYSTVSALLEHGADSTSARSLAARQPHMGQLMDLLGLTGHDPKQQRPNTYSPGFYNGRTTSDNKPR